MNIESIVNKEIAIHCPTLKEVENLFNMYKIPIIQGHNSWNRSKDMTCYRITKQQDKHYFTFEFCDKNWYKKTGCAIISFEEFYKNIQNTELLEKLNDFTHRDFTENKEPQIISKEATTATIIISEIHKNNCEIEVLQYLQRWIIEALNNSQ